MKRLVTIALVAAALAGCGGTGTDTIDESTQVSGIGYVDSVITGGGYTVQAQLGDLDGASVTVKEIVSGDTIWEGTTRDGVFKIPDSVYIQDDGVYLITVSNGTDLDTNDDGFYGDSAPNHGTIYAIVAGKDIKDNDLVVSPLSTYVYETLYKPGYFGGGGIAVDVDVLKKVGYKRLRNAFGNIVISYPFTIYNWGMNDDIYDLMKDYIDDIRGGETDLVKIGRDMREIRNFENAKAYCIDFIPETGHFIPITDSSCNQKRLEDYDYYGGEVAVGSAYPFGSWKNATGVTVSSAKFWFPDGRSVTLFDERPGDITWVGVAGKDIYTLLMQPSGDGIIYHFEVIDDGVVKEEGNVTVPGAQKFYLVTSKNKGSTNVFVQTATGVKIYDSDLHLYGEEAGASVEIPGYYFIKLSNGKIYNSSYSIVTEFDRYAYSQVVDNDTDGYLYVNGKPVMPVDYTSVESNSKKTFFGNYLFYQPGNDTTYDVNNVTMVNLDYVL